MNSFFQTLGRRAADRRGMRRGSLRPRRSAVPALESLEERCVPSTLSGFVFNDLNNNGVMATGEAGIAGATVTLTGTNNLNQKVNLTTQTDSTGAYSFANLAAGTYALKESAPSGYLLGTPSAGSQGGTASGSTLTGIVLGPTDTATDYDFGNLATANGWSAVQSNFNGTAIAAGSTVWFSSVFKVSGVGSTPVTLNVTNQTISFTANGSATTLSVPNSTITIDPAATTATTTFDAATNSWQTTLPTQFSGNAYLGGVELAAPNGLPGGINPVTWQGQFTTDTAGISVNWQWAAAVYTNFSTDYNALNVKPVDDNHLSQYQNSDHAGTPEAFTKFVTGGARGGGGSNFTGSLSPTVTVKVPVQQTPPPPPPSSSLSGYVFLNGSGEGGVTVTLAEVNSQGQTVTFTTTTQANGSYTFSGLQPGSYTISESPPLGITESSASAGSAGGSTLPSGAVSVGLSGGTNGTDYDFFNIFSGS
jgi:hypothetical protein